MSIVHCRIGSLENASVKLSITKKVHCRIGSLEMQQELSKMTYLVHCRIGSLENAGGDRERWA